MIGIGLYIFQDQTVTRQVPAKHRSVTRFDAARDEALFAPEPEEDDSADKSLRHEFARAMAKVKKGMTTKEVQELLGKPDDIRTQYDPGGIRWGHAEIWNYGSDGHLTFPTLGAICFDHDEKVADVFGGRGKPPASELFSEEELRSLLRLIDKIPSYNGGCIFDPLPLIQVVNRLQRLGKEKALAALSEYLRVASRQHERGREGVFLVLRVLFDVPEDPGYMPEMIVGAPCPDGPRNPFRLTRYPILLQDDVPLLLVSNYMLAGVAENPERHVRYFRRVGRLRDKPLAPTNAPLGLMDSWAKNAGWLYDDPGKFCDGETIHHGKILIANQLLNLLGTVYHKVPDKYGQKFSCLFLAGVDSNWSAIAGEISKLKIKWNVDKNCYTFEDGSQLPAPSRKLYRRHIWKMEGHDGKSELILERKDKENVECSFRWSGGQLQKRQGFLLEVLAVQGKANPLAKFASVPLEAFDVKLPEGAEIQARLIIAEREQLSPVYNP